MDRRRSIIRPHYDPDALRRHLSNLLATQVATGRGLGHPSYKWRVGGFRVRDIARALTRPGTSDDIESPHPDTPRWQDQGVTLAGPSWAEQSAQLRAFARRLAMPGPGELAGEPSILPELSRQLADVDGFARRLTSAVASLGLESGWISHRVGAGDQP